MDSLPYCTFKKHVISEVQKPTDVCIFAVANHLCRPLRKQNFALLFNSWVRASVPRVIAEIRDNYADESLHPQRRSGYVRSGQPEGSGFKFC